MSDTPEEYIATTVDLKDVNPETYAALVDHMPANETEWSMHYLELSRLCRKLENERDDLRKALSQILEELGDDVDRYSCDDKVVIYSDVVGIVKKALKL